MIGKLFKAMHNSRGKINKAIKSILNNSLSSEEIDKIQQVLIQTDMGYDTVEDIINISKSFSSNDNKIDLNREIKNILADKLPDTFNPAIIDRPSIFMLVGVNGSGKTTSAAKLAYMYKNLGLDITLIAADTYRAAAIDQLKIWSKRLDCRLIYNKNTSKPSSIIFDGLASAQSNGSDLVIIDTAGRLHTSDNLMLELDKMYRVIKSRYNNFNFNSYITIDATMGQNSFNQARIFHKIKKIDGVILTKLDGTARGGIVVPLFNKLKIPVKFICTGEQLEDMEAFNKGNYLSSLIDFS